MKCPKCHCQNRENVKFCEECGSKMEMLCPSCGKAIPLGKKFCGECGASLSVPTDKPTKDLSVEEKIEKIQRYLPKGLADKILPKAE